MNSVVRLGQGGVGRGGCVLSQTLADSQGVAGKKLLRGKSSAAFSLEFDESQRRFATAHDDAALVGAQNRPGLPRQIHKLSPPDLQ